MSDDRSSGLRSTRLDFRPVAGWYLHPTVVAHDFGHLLTSNSEPSAPTPQSSGLASTSQCVLSDVTVITGKDKEAYMRKTVSEMPM